MFTWKLILWEAKKYTNTTTEYYSYSYLIVHGFFQRRCYLWKCYAESSKTDLSLFSAPFFVTDRTRNTSITLFLWLIFFYQFYCDNLYIWNPNNRRSLKRGLRKRLVMILWKGTLKSRKSSWIGRLLSINFLSFHVV